MGKLGGEVNRTKVELPCSNQVYMSKEVQNGAIIQALVDHGANLNNIQPYLPPKMEVLPLKRKLGPK